MISLKKIVAAAATALAFSASSVSAAQLGGVFGVEIYTYQAGGSSANAYGDMETRDDVIAGDFGAYTLTTLTYDGLFDFYTSGAGTTLQSFFDSATGTVSNLVGDLSITMTAGSFTTTSLFVFTAFTPTVFSGNIQHDDGIQLWADNTIVANSPAPTASGDTNFVFTGGQFQLFYSAANGNPEELDITFEGDDPNLNQVPLPAGGLLLLTALGGILVARRRT